MKLRLITPIVTARFENAEQPRPLVRPRPVANMVAAATMAAAPSVTTASEIISPIPQTRMLVPPLSHQEKQTINTAVAMAKNAIASRPGVLRYHVESKDDYRRVYAVELKADSLGTAFDLLAPRLAHHSKVGTRLCLYLAGDSDLKPVIASLGRAYAWQSCGKNMFLIYPRASAGVLTKEWAVTTKKAVLAQCAVHEAGITIEFPTE